MSGPIRSIQKKGATRRPTPRYQGAVSRPLFRTRLLGAEGYEVACFADAASFLAAHDPGRSGCAVIDLGLPDLDGLELQGRLAAAASCRPILFLTGQVNIPASVRAMRAGAVDFLTKPVEPVDLIRSIRSAIERDGTLRLQKAAVDGQSATLDAGNAGPQHGQANGLGVG